MSKVFAFLLLLFIAPILLLIGIIIKIAYPGPLFYKQLREGKNGSVFYIWKLRTMVADADVVLAELIKSNTKIEKEWRDFGCLQDDPRIAGYAAKLARQLSIDELPQLLNILKGEMAFIGPRPLEIYLAESLDTKNRTARNAVKPGLTGLWQIGPRSTVNIRQMQHYDLLYIKKRSLLLDSYILCKTLIVVFKRTGA
jgi:exopolysaccharide production protein ExoY